MFPWDHAIVVLKQKFTQSLLSFLCFLWISRVLLFLCKCSDVLYIEIPSHASCQVRFTVYFCIRWLPGTLCVCLFLLVRPPSSSSRSLFISLHFVRKIMQQENTSNSLLNCKTTLMCTTVNSLWLNNLPFSQTFKRGGCKLCTAILESEGEEDDV